MKNPTVVIADDQTCIRKMAALILPAENVEVIGEARDGMEAFDVPQLQQLVGADRLR